MSSKRKRRSTGSGGGDDDGNDDDTFEMTAGAETEASTLDMADDAAMARPPLSDDDSDSDDESGYGGGGIPLTGTMQENNELGDDDDDDDDDDDQYEDKARHTAGGSSSSSSSSSSRSSAAKKKGAAESEHLDITFEFQDPGSDFFHALRGMLKDFLPQGHVNISDLSDTIVKKPEIGTIVVQEGGTDVFAFITAVNLGPHRVSVYMHVAVATTTCSCQRVSFPIRVYSFPCIFLQRMPRVYSRSAVF